MPKEVALHNFKRFDDQGVQIRLGRITVLIGANGTGKSSILQALLLLKQSLRRTELTYNGTEVALGSLRDVVHLQRMPKFPRIAIRVDFGFPLPMPNSQPQLPQAGTIGYSIEFGNGFHEDIGSLSREGEEILSVSFAGAASVGSSQDVEMYVDDTAFTFRFAATGVIGRPFNFGKDGNLDPAHFQAWLKVMQLVEDATVTYLARLQGCRRGRIGAELRANVEVGAGE